MVAKKLQENKPKIQNHNNSEYGKARLPRNQRDCLKFRDRRAGRDAGWWRSSELPVQSSCPSEPLLLLSSSPPPFYLEFVIYAPSSRVGFKSGGEHWNRSTLVKMFETKFWRGNAYCPFLFFFSFFFLIFNSFIYLLFLSFPLYNLD